MKYFPAGVAPDEIDHYKGHSMLETSFPRRLVWALFSCNGK